jgi:hypothetical protein
MTGGCGRRSKPANHYSINGFDTSSDAKFQQIKNENHKTKHKEGTSFQKQFKPLSQNMTKKQTALKIQAKNTKKIKPCSKQKK